VDGVKCSPVRVSASVGGDMKSLAEERTGAAAMVKPVAKARRVKRSTVPAR